MQQGVQMDEHVTSDDVGSCWPTISRPFARGFTVTDQTTHDLQLNLYLRPPLVSDHLPKRQNFPSLSFTVGTSRKRATSCKRPRPLFGPEGLWFSIALTYCKRPFDAFSDLYVRCMHYVPLCIRKTLVTTSNYTCRNLDIARNKLSSTK